MSSEVPGSFKSISPSPFNWEEGLFSSPEFYSHRHPHPCSSCPRWQFGALLSEGTRTRHWKFLGALNDWNLKGHFPVEGGSSVSRCCFSCWYPQLFPRPAFSRRLQQPQRRSCLRVSGNVTWTGCNLLLFGSLWTWTSNDCSFKKKKTNTKSSDGFPYCWDAFLEEQEWENKAEVVWDWGCYANYLALDDVLKFCTPVMPFSFFLCILPGNFAGFSLVMCSHTVPQTTEA